VLTMGRATSAVRPSELQLVTIDARLMGREVELDKWGWLKPAVGVQDQRVRCAKMPSDRFDRVRDRPRLVDVSPHGDRLSAGFADRAYDLISGIPHARDERADRGDRGTGRAAWRPANATAASSRHPMGRAIGVPSHWAARFLLS
jgi:hypothetical protein